MKKQKLMSILVAGGLFIQSLFMGIAPWDCNAATVTDSLKVEHTSYDTNVIPDKYNTGTSGELTTIEIGQKVGDVQLKASGNSTVNVFDFYYQNKDISGSVTFENMDFSQYMVALYNADKVDREIQLIFKNCKFSKCSLPKATTLITCEFYNCSFTNVSGSNIVFDYCQFGQNYTDGLVPFQNVEVNNCFFYDFTTATASDGEVHTDGTQIYGAAEIDVENVSYNKCRFEIPPIENEGSTAYVNACIMLQMEYSNANGVSFNDCLVNGGGYTIYARSKSDYILTDIVFDNIQFGCTYKYGYFYPDVASDVTVSNLSNIDSLYIGSVWKDSNETHFSVTNDTAQERTLTIYTNTGTYEYTIPACPTSDEFTTSMTYADMPFDLDISVPEDCTYAICYDTTGTGLAQQLRFVNWSEQDVYLEQTQADELFSNEEQLIASGSCGGNITYTLTSTGILTLSGEGETYSYHSTKPVPWDEYKSQITEVRVLEGITGLGSQIFRGCTGIQSLSLPEGLTSVGTRAFSGCTCLTEITLPNSIVSIGNSAFDNALLDTIYFNGTEEEWSQVEVGTGHDAWINNVTYLVTTTPGTESTEDTATEEPGSTESTEDTATEEPGSTESTEDTATEEPGSTESTEDTATEEPGSTESTEDTATEEPGSTESTEDTATEEPGSTESTEDTATEEPGSTESTEDTATEEPGSTESTEDTVTEEPGSTESTEDTATEEPGSTESTEDTTTEDSESTESTEAEYVNPFKDVAEDAWYAKSVQYVVQKGLFTGTSADTFTPNGQMTRGMLVTVLYRAVGRPEVTGGRSYPDVKSDAYYAKAVAWASSIGMATGYSDGKFHPNDPVTREQVAKILYHYAKYTGQDVTAKTDITGYRDYYKISDYAVKYMEWAAAENVITGSSNKLNPKGNATRAEVASMLRRFLKD